MINEENSSYYLRYLVKVSDKKPIPIDEIPKVFRDYFSIAGLCRSINISVPPPKVQWSEVESYINETYFNDFESFIQGINSTFSTNIDKYYAIYYYLTHHLKRDQKKESSSISDIFKTEKARYSEYNTFFIESAKKVGFNSDTNQISEYDYGTRCNWNILQPPKESKYNNTCVYITIDNDQFITLPYNGTGYYNSDEEFVFEYKKQLFLIPIYLSLSLYIPKDSFLQGLKLPFTFEEYSKLNKADFDKELSFETSPFQIIEVQNGTYEFQFSYNDYCLKFIIDMFIFNGDKWESRDGKFASIECLESELPSRFYTLNSDKKRSRYKLTVCFPEKGTWLLKIFERRKYFFEVCFKVEKGSGSLLSLPGYDLDEARFHPILPIEGLTAVSDGYARIRFAIKKKRSNLLIYLYKIKPGTFTRESETKKNDCCRTFTSELPFDIESEDEDERLVEDWILVEFPENGRWEVYIYFKNDEGSYSYGVTYYFDVEGSLSTHIDYSIFDVPKTLNFIPFKTDTPKEVWTEPSSSVVIINEFDFYFHIFSEKKLKVYFVQTDDKEDQTVWPTLMSEKDTGSNDIFDREYSVTFTKKGSYEMNLWGEKCLGRQKYFVIDFDLQEETKEERILMRKFKEKLNGELDYTDDIPLSIQKNVDKLLKDAKKHKEEELKREKQNKSEMDEKEIKRRRDEERHREEEDQEEMRRQEKEERDKKEKERREKIELEKFEKQKKQQKKIQLKNSKIKSNSSQFELTNLRQIASDLEEQNQKLDSRLDEMERRENLLKLEFNKQINQLRNEWERKDQKLTEERLESSRRRKIEFEDIERREKLLSTRKIQNLNERIRHIEEQLELDPEKRKELVKLQQQLIEEENKDIFSLSARRQKRIDEERKEELEFEEKSLNESFKKINQINKLEDEYMKHKRKNEFELDDGDEEEEDSIDDVDPSSPHQEKVKNANNNDDVDVDVGDGSSCSVKINETQKSEKRDDNTKESKNEGGRSNCCLLI